MVKKKFWLFSKLIGYASLVALSMNVSLQASDATMIDINRLADPCEVTHHNLRVLNKEASLDLVHYADIKEPRQPLADGMSFIVGCKHCNKYDKGWTNLIATTSNGKDALMDTISSLMLRYSLTPADYIYGYITPAVE